MAESAEDFIAEKSAAWTRELAGGTVHRTNDTGGKAFHNWVREAWTFLPQSDNPECVSVIERLRYTGADGQPAVQGPAVGDVQYRLCYYIVGKTGDGAGRWLWGRFALLIPGPDLGRLIDLARKEGTLRPEDEPQSH